MNLNATRRLGTADRRVNILQELYLKLPSSIPIKQIKVTIIVLLSFEKINILIIKGNLNYLPIVFSLDK